MGKGQSGRMETWQKGTPITQAGDTMVVLTKVMAVEGKEGAKSVRPGGV